MLPRPLIILLIPLAGGLGGMGAYRFFRPIADYVCVGSFPVFIKVFQNAEDTGRMSFAISAGILAACIPICALMTAQFRKKANYLNGLLLGLLVAVLTSALGIFYYRHGLQSAMMKTGEFFVILNNSKREVIFNPLTRSLLYASIFTLFAGAVRGVVSPIKGKR